MKGLGKINAVTDSDIFDGAKKERLQNFKFLSDASKGGHSSSGHFGYLYKVEKLITVS